MKLSDFKKDVIEAKDKITGFKGTVIGYCTYSTGCDQYLLSPPVSNDGDFKDSRWFDEARLVVIGKREEIVAQELVGESNGCDISAPTK